MTFQRDLLAEFDRDLERGAELVSAEYVARVQRDPAMPRDTGKLADGVVPTGRRAAPGRVITTIASTFRSADGADVGTILDLSTGRVVEASDYGHKAFGPFNGDDGPRTFRPRFRVTTKHVGWWAAVNRDSHLRAASEELRRVNL